MGTQRPDFAEFYRGSRDDCLRTVLVSVGNRDTAQDLVDEAFARACASWRTVSRHPAPTAWVIRTALNANVSRWRRRRREVPVPDPGTLADLPAVSGIPDGPVDPRIMAALLRLPGRQRQVVALRLFLDLDTARTAEVLGVAPSTVKAHLSRALATLRADLISNTPHHADPSPISNTRITRTHHQFPTPGIMRTHHDLHPTAGGSIMNDDELITALRESFTGVRATTPVEQIVSRSHAVRARRRIPRVAGAAGAAGAALAAIALLPASQPALHLAAWTVVKRADGTIYVTINQLLDPAGLQRTLRADGVPASVTFFGKENGSCQRYANGDETSLLGKVFSQPPGQINSAVIRPSAIPRGAGVQISPVINGGQVPAIAVGIVDASPQCTGS